MRTWIMTLHPVETHRNRTRRRVGAALVALAAGGGVAIWHAAALSEIRLWCAVLLVQALAIAAATGVALVVALPSAGSGQARPPWGMIRR
jgi:hypothetical protein